MKLKFLPLSLVAAFALLFANLSVAAETVSEGSFTQAFKSWGKKSVEGDWKIVKDGDRLILELGDNFAAKTAPDIKVFLSKQTAGDISGKNATQQAVFVQKISSFKGKQTIELPAGTKLSDFKTLVIHCEEYSKLWGTAAL